MKVKQLRKWFLTINSKDEKITLDDVRQSLEKLNKVTHYLISKERGSINNTLHYHLYIEFKNGIRNTTIKKIMKDLKPDIEQPRGTYNEIKEYIRCEGAHEDKKPLLEDFIESGEPNKNNQGKRTDIDDVITMIQEGANLDEIMFEYPKTYLKYQNKIDTFWLKWKERKYKTIKRDIEVYYVYGASGTGKTSGIYKKHGYEDVYRVSNYNNPFDTYQAQDVMVLDEFHGQMQFADLLKITEGYPYKLQARYQDRVACFTKLYIVSNMNWADQYANLQIEKSQVYEAMYRRISAFIEVNDFGDFENYFENSKKSFEEAQKIYGKEIVKRKDLKR
jgi:hypothetical protein